MSIINIFIIYIIKLVTLKRYVLVVLLRSKTPKKKKKMMMKMIKQYEKNKIK